MSELTAFQEKCGDELRRVLQAAGQGVRRWEVVKGQHERYIEANLGSVKIWIYTDGACWQGLGRDRGFETPDYNALDDLQQAFMGDVATAVTQGAAQRGQ